MSSVALFSSLQELQKKQPDPINYSREDIKGSGTPSLAKFHWLLGRAGEFKANNPLASSFAPPLPHILPNWANEFHFHTVKYIILASPANYYIVYNNYFPPEEEFLCIQRMLLFVLKTLLFSGTMKA